MNKSEKSLLATLPPKWRRIAIALRIVVFLFFLAGIFMAAYIVLFPSRTFEFFFRTPGALKNTIVDPRTQNGAENIPIEKGRLEKDKPLVFDTDLVGDFSLANLTLQLEKKSQPLKDVRIKVRKSYRSFLYPQGEPMPLPEGTLIFTEGTYNIVSEGKLRAFDDTALMQQMGFARQMFANVQPSVLSTTPQGDLIDSPAYPDGTYFLIEEKYYQLLDGQLVAFVSDSAFLSRADSRQAVPQTAELFEKIPLSEKLLGFRDGSLVSSADSVFILSDGKRYPIDNTFTFEAMGLSWDDVRPVTAEELSLYEKQKLFTQNSPHPDGTIFTDRKTNQSFLIREGTKRQLIDPILTQTYLRGSSAVLADNESLDISSSCTAEKKFDLFAKTYDCLIPIGSLHDLAGNDYQFETISTSDISLNHASVRFNKVIGRDNSISSLAEIKRRILNTYYGTQQ